MFDQLINAISSALPHQNEFLTGGFFLMLIGAIGAYARRVPGRIYHWCLSRCIITLDITNEDPSFYWLAGWLSTQPYSKRARNLSVTTYRDAYGNLQRNRRVSGACSNDAPRSADDKPQLPEIIFTPAVGNHIFLYNRRPIWLVRSRDNQKPSDDGFSFFTKESFQIRMIARSQKTARALIEEARQLSYVEKEVRTDIYVYTGYEGFRRVDSCELRPMRSVFLPEGVSEDIVTKIRKFLDSHEWYQSRGIPWRLSFLLFGIPGTGKTSVIKAVTGDFKMDLYMLNLSSVTDDSRLAYALSGIPPRSVILLEEVDALFNQREKSADTDTKLSFAGLVTALDGVATREGWIVFMTTNHKDRLDPALIRKGRADHHIEFGYADAYQCRSIFRAFFPHAATEDVERFGELVAQCEVPMCDVQAHLVEYEHSAAEALAKFEPLEVVERVA